MGVESPEDLAGFFDTADHAVEATWSGAPGTPITGIYEAPYFDETLAAEIAGIESSQPVFRTPTSSVPGVKQNDTLTISGVVYIITNVRPDGTGVTDLALNRQ